MEANFFRFAAEELFQKIQGVRIEKVYQPAARVWTFSLGAAGNLMFFCRPKGGGFFLSHEKPANPASPSSSLMWLRKRIRNRRISGFINMWPFRKMALELSGAKDYLVLDITQAPSLAQDLPENQGNILWPDIDQVAAREDIWKEYPQLTPLLRTTLKSLDRETALVLLDELSRGRPRGFHVAGNETGKNEPVCFHPVNRAIEKSFPNALEAARFWGMDQVWKMTDRVAEQEKQQSRALKRVRRNLDKLRKDRERLRKMAREAENGELIKQHLYQLDPKLKADSISLEDMQGLKHSLELDPTLDLTGNMQKFFRRAAKARRGLDFIEKREAELLRQFQDLDNQPRQLLQSDNQACSKKKRSQWEMGRTRDTDFRRFVSSEGFLILRARNQKAGQKLISSIAAPHDLWFHVQDGPGAHVILKRDNPQTVVSEKSMLEAAGLAALASFRKNDHKAEVMCARAADLRRVKGMDPGKALVDRIIDCFAVGIDPQLEKNLEI